MKILLSILGFGIVLCLFTNQANGQMTVTASAVTNPPAIECTNTFLNVSGFHNYGGYSYQGVTVNISGTTVNVTLNYTFGIGIAVITPFTQSVNIGMIPGGSYTLMTNGTVNGTASATFSSPLTVNNCCGAVAAFSTNQPSYCLGDSVYFTNSSTGSTSQQWFNNGIPVSSSMNYATTVTSASMDIDLVVDNGSCFDTLSQTIVGMSIPVINSLAVTADTVCVGELLVFSSNSTGAIGANGKIWYKGAATAGFGTNHTTFASGAGPHDYTFIASNGACADTAVITVEYVEAASIDSFVFVATSVCLGDYVTGTTYTNGATLTDWYIDGVFSATSGSGSTFSNIPTAAGSYSYKMITSNGVCSDSITQTIVVNDLPTVDLGADTSACAGTVVLDAGTGLFYLWSDGSTVQNLSVNAPGTYYVTVTNTGGCTATDTILFTSCLSLGENSIQLFKLGPNPTAGKTTLVLGKIYPSIDIQVLDVNGKMVKQEIFKYKEGIELDFSDLDHGLYLIHVSTKQGNEILRLIKE